MKLAVVPPYQTGLAANPSAMVELARHAEQIGLEAIYFAEHMVIVRGHKHAHHYTEDGSLGIPEDSPFPDPLAMLGHIAALTVRLRLGTGMLILPQHHPVQLAKRLATMDLLSGGRVQVGVAIGWMHEELAALNVDPATRGRRVEESIHAMRALWSGPDASHHGEFFSFTGATCLPGPVQPGGVPIHIGGHSEAAARRAGRVGDGFQPLGVEWAVLRELVAVARSAAEDAGRDPQRLEVTQTTPLAGFGADVLEQALTHGVDRLIFTTVGDDLAPINDGLESAVKLRDST